MKYYYNLIVLVKLASTYPVWDKKMFEKLPVSKIGTTLEAAREEGRERRNK